jgi:hypothetical protein
LAAELIHLGASVNGKATGVYILNGLLETKRLEIMQEVVSGPALIGIAGESNFLDVGVKSRRFLWLSDAGDELPACEMVLDVIGDLFTHGCQLKHLVFDDRIVSLLGKLPILDCFVPEIVTPVHVTGIQ